MISETLPGILQPWPEGSKLEVDKRNRRVNSSKDFDAEQHQGQGRGIDRCRPGYQPFTPGSLLLADSKGQRNQCQFDVPRLEQHVAQPAGEHLGKYPGAL